MLPDTVSILGVILFILENLVKTRNFGSKGDSGRLSYQSLGPVQLKVGDATWKDCWHELLNDPSSPVENGKVLLGWTKAPFAPTVTNASWT